MFAHAYDSSRATRHPRWWIGETGAPSVTLCWWTYAFGTMEGSSESTNTVNRRWLAGWLVGWLPCEHHSSCEWWMWYWCLNRRLFLIRIGTGWCLVVMMRAKEGNYRQSIRLVLTPSSSSEWHTTDNRQIGIRCESGSHPIESRWARRQMGCPNEFWFFKLIVMKSLLWQLSIFFNNVLTVILLGSIMVIIYDLVGLSKQ